MTPPPYPRIPHLVSGRGTRDDLVLDASSVRELLSHEAVAEEKLDGANVAVWKGSDGRPTAALRGGPEAPDRTGQRGQLRAWTAAHDLQLDAVLDDWPVLFGEWMLLTHTVAYSHLPSYFVALDLWRDGGGFAEVDARNAICRDAGLNVPPELWRGVPGRIEFLEGLLGCSTWGDERAEGIVVRRVGAGEPRLAKLVRSGFAGIDDHTWRSGRPRNQLEAGQVSWI